MYVCMYICMYAPDLEDMQIFAGQLGLMCVCVCIKSWNDTQILLAGNLEWECMYVCVCVRMHIRIHVCVCIRNICMHIHNMYADDGRLELVCMHRCMYICMYAWIYAHSCMDVYTCMYWYMYNTMIYVRTGDCKINGNQATVFNDFSVVNWYKNPLKSVAGFTIILQITVRALVKIIKCLYHRICKSWVSEYSQTHYTCSCDVCMGIRFK